jgi:hypothetical protein
MSDGRDSMCQYRPKEQHMEMVRSMEWAMLGGVWSKDHVGGAMSM